MTAPGIAELCYTYFPETEEEPEFIAYWYNVGNEILAGIDVSFATDCDTTFENVGIVGVYPDGISPRFGIVHWECVGGTHTIEDCVFEKNGIFACGPFWCSDAKYIFKSNVIDTAERGFQSAMSSGMDILVVCNDIYHIDWAGIMNWHLDSSIMLVARNNMVDVDGGFWGAKWIEAAYNAGLIPACETSPELRFCPDAPLDRAMAAYMMVQAKGLNLP